MIKLGIVGTGSVSHWHNESMEDVYLLPVMWTKKLRKFSTVQNKKFFYSIDDLLLNSDVDAILIPLQINFKEIAIKALTVENIFFQKPLQKL